MPLIKGIDQPVRDYLSDLRSASQAGLCMVSDPRGIPDPVNGKRYAYIIHPDSPTAASFYRIDLESRAAEALLQLPAAIGGAYNFAICAALYDPTGGVASNRPGIYVLVSLTAAPWAQWMFYDIGFGTWAVLLPPACGPAGATPLAVSVALCHPCGTLGNFAALNANIAEDYIYAVGDSGQWGVAGPSQIARYGKAAGIWANLTGAGGARAAAPAAGSKCVWLPTYPNSIFSTRGGASALWDVYGFVANAWAAGAATIPATVLGEGTELATLYEAPGWVAVRSPIPGNMIYAVEAGNILGGVAAPLHTVASIDDSPLPAAHAQNALIAWWIAGGYYFGAIPYGRSVIKRIQVPMPL